MKVVFIIDQMHMHGGIERVLSIKANYLAQDNSNEIHVVTTEQKNKAFCYALDSAIVVKDLDINYHRSKSYFHPVNLLKLPKHVFKIRSLLQKIKPNVVVVCSHSTDTYFLPFILKKTPKIKEFHYSKFIEEVYRKPESKSKKKYFLKFTDYVERKYDRIVVLNKDEQKYYKSSNTVVIPNPLTFFPKEVSKVANNVFIAAGRIAPVKRFDLLIDIWAKVVQEMNHLKLHIYGDGDPQYVQKLKQKITDLNLSHAVFLKGPTHNIKDKMLGASTYLMTSQNECFPLVLLEAQSCGLPIIAFDCPHGPRNIINEETGALIPMSNQSLFATTVVNFINHKSRLEVMGKKARENSLNYQVEKIMPLWVNLFNSLN